MLLPTKRDAEALKKIETKKELDEAAKLYRSVDGLRKAVVAEKENLLKFQEESLKKVKEDINKVIDQKNLLMLEVKELKELKVYLQIPLDKEWEKVREEQNKLSKFATELQSDYMSLNERKAETELKETELRQEESRIADIKLQVVRNLTRSEENKLKSSEILSRNTKVEEELDLKIAMVEKELRERELAVASRERDMGMKELQIEKDKQDIINNKKLLEDRRKTLERAIKRNG